MYTLRKTFLPIARAATVAILLLTASATRAQVAAQEKRVTLRVLSGNYVSTAASGGLELVANPKENKMVFEVIDANGGELADGDKIKIRYTPRYTSDAGKNKPSFWFEEAGKIKRTNAEPRDETETFRLMTQGAGFVLQTASGKFVGEPYEDGLGLVDALRSALTFKFEQAAPEN